MENARVGLGIVTYNRPKYFEKCLRNVLKNVSSIDFLLIYNDGSQDLKTYKDIVTKLYSRKVPFNFLYHEDQENRGVAVAKNWLLKRMMDEGCEYLFLLEDDILIKDDRAITGYISSSQQSGLLHLNFAWHGKGNVGGPLYSDKLVSYHKECIGAFSYYHKSVIEKVGYMDENFKNAWEHVEHTKRIGDAGLTSPFWLFADATGSENWLEEIKDSIENSVIRTRDDWQKNIDEGMAYWKSKDGKGIPLQE